MTYPTTRAGRAEYRAMIAAQRARQKPLDLPAHIAHGTCPAYRRGCKCAPCRKANSDRTRRFKLYGPLRKGDPDRPWRHICLITDHPGEDTGAECQLPLGHDGQHDWQTVQAVA